MAPYLLYSVFYVYNYQIPIVNETQQNKTIKQELLTCVDFDSHVKEPILEMLPDNLVEQMKDHLIEENRLSKKYTGKEISPKDYETVSSGYLFELLNYNEYIAKQFRGKTEGTKEWEEAEDIVKVSSTLCRIARYPQEYGLKIDIRSRIPDGVYVGMNKEGDFNIYGLAEAKLGGLDNRAIDQIKMTGSRTTMAAIVEQVDTLIQNTPEENLHEDLQDLKKLLNGRHLKVKWKDSNGKKELSMHLDLLVPTRGGSQGAFSPFVVFEDPSIAPIYHGIERSPAQNMSVKNSPFSASEVHRMTQKVLQEIEF